MFKQWGRELAIAVACVDSGFHQGIVQGFCSGRQSRNAMPWLEVDKDNFKAKVTSLPRRDDVQTPPINEQLIVELYSK